MRASVKLITAALILLSGGGCSDEKDSKSAPKDPMENTGHCGYSQILYCWACVNLYRGKEYIIRCQVEPKK